MSVGEVVQMTRIEILEQNEWLDALEEAEDRARPKPQPASQLQKRRR